MSPRVPKYRLHKGSGQALVQINGQRIYLGKFGTDESHEKYRRVIAEWLVTSEPPAKESSTSSGTAVNELALAFLRHAELRYVKHGRPTSEMSSFKTALRPVLALYGHQLVSDFGPLALIACRQQLIDRGICRKRVNQHVTRIRQVFKWGVARELVAETTWRSLCAVEGLRVGEAKETRPVKPVPEEYVVAIESYVTPQVWAMINLQRWTGCRPGEACAIRGMDVRMQGEIWEYHPNSHKTEHHGRERVILLGPHAQDVIRPWLKPALNAYLFSPREARAWSQARRAENRRTPQPTRRRTQRKPNPKRAPGQFYTTLAYGHAITRACEKAGVPHWTPNQLRHNAATRIRSSYGIEAARIILGHASAVTSEIYAEFDINKAKEIMQQLG
jgi:integrase